MIYIYKCFERLVRVLVLSFDDKYSIINLKTCRKNPFEWQGSRHSAFEIFIEKITCHPNATATIIANHIHYELHLIVKNTRFSVYITNL